MQQLLGERPVVKIVEGQTPMTIFDIFDRTMFFS